MGFIVRALVIIIAGILAIILTAPQAPALSSPGAVAAVADCGSYTTQLAKAAGADGYHLAQIQRIPNGEVAIFSKDPNHVRVIAVMMVIEEARVLVKERGFQRIGECSAPGGDILQVVTRDLDVDLKTGNPI